MNNATRAALIELRDRVKGIERSINLILGVTDHDNHDDILDTLAKHPWGLSMTELNAKCRVFRDLHPTEKKSTLNNLLREGKILMKKRASSATAKKPATFIFPVEEPMGTVEPDRDDDY